MIHYVARSGRMLAEDGSIVNIADILGGEDIGERADINKYMPMSGRMIKEDGTIVNIARNIGKGGQTAELQPLTITIGESVYTYDGKTAVSIELEPAEGVTF